MGRATELFDYISRKNEPGSIDELYFSLTITPELQEFRQRYQKSLTKASKNGLIEEDDGTYSLW